MTGRTLRQGVLFAAIALLALLTGFMISSWMRQPTPPEGGAAQALFSAPMHDLENRPQTLEQYRGKVLVVNFWATWCPPCREEIPYFIATQQELADKGVQFVGIALDDPAQVAPYVLEMNMNYPVLIGGINEQEAMRKLGNASGGLPFTLIYDRSGQLREQIIGGLDQARLQQALAPYL